MKTAREVIAVVDIRLTARATVGWRVVLGVLACLFLPGCGMLGPHTVSRDQFNYTAAVSDSWKKQMLLNLVKIRYNDPPVFLEVSSIISQYSLETSLNAGVSWDALLPGDSESLGAAGRYADRPTITYSPVRGEEFARSLATPILPVSLVSLIQAGWPVDRVLLTCVQSINGLDNRTATMALSRQADPDFYRLIVALRRIQQTGGVGVRLEKKGAGTTTVMSLDSGRNGAVRDDIRLVQTLLGLNPNVAEYELVYGRLARDPNEVAILSRSMLVILLEMATGVEIPPRDLEEGRVVPVLTPTATEAADLSPGIRIPSGAQVPEDAFVSVKYRGHRFWIDDRDPRSKGTFSFLMILFSLAESSGPSKAPLVTIPVG